MKEVIFYTPGYGNTINGFTNSKHLLVIRELLESIDMYHEEIAVKDVLIESDDLIQLHKALKDHLISLFDEVSFQNKVLVDVNIEFNGKVYPLSFNTEMESLIINLHVVYEICQHALVAQNPIHIVIRPELNRPERKTLLIVRRAQNQISSKEIFEQLVEKSDQPIEEEELGVILHDLEEKKLIKKIDELYEATSKGKVVL